MIIDLNAAVAELVPAYLERREAEIQILETALEAGELPVIQRIAHNMKGTGSGYGVPALTEIGQRLEAAAKSGDGPAIGALITELSDLLVTLKNSLTPAARR